MLTFDLAIYVFFTASVAFIIKGIAGFGDPLISSPLLAMRFDNKIITPALLPVALILNIYIVIKNRKNFNWKVVAPIAGWVIIGIIPGTFLLKTGDAAILKMLLGILITTLGIEMLTRNNAKIHKENTILKAIICICSGLFSGMFGINLLFLIYMERTAGNRHEFRANTCFIFALDSIFRVIVYIMGDVFTPLSLSISVITIPAAIIGMFIGSLIDKRLGEKNVKRIVIWAFILGGISTFVKAVM